MALQPLNTYVTRTGIVSTTEQEVYRTKTGYTSIVLYAQIANVGGTGIGTATFTHKRESRSQTGITTTKTEIIDRGPVPPNDSLIVLEGRLVLERTALKTDSILIAGISSSLAGYQANQTHMKYTISILETLNQ
jgi:hypothetical protein